jgi:hypothetical protein
VAQPTASSQEKEDIEWWIVLDVDNISGYGLGVGLFMGFRKKGGRENFKIFVFLE